MRSRTIRTMMLATPRLVYQVAADGAQTSELARMLQDSSYQVRSFPDIDAVRVASEQPHDERPAAVILIPESADRELAGVSGLSGLGLGGAGGPPLLLLSSHDDMASRLASQRAGVTHHLHWPASRELVIPLLDQLITARTAPPCRALLVDGDMALLGLYGDALRAAGFQVRLVARPLDVLEALDAFEPDVIVLDIHMPGIDGIEIATAVSRRAVHLGRDLPILFLTGELEHGLRMRVLDSGVDDLLPKPVDPAHLVAVVAARACRARKNNQMHRRMRTALYEQRRKQLALDMHAIVSRTDSHGVITHVNQKFCEVSGYSRAELIGQNHRILKSGKHAPDFYQRMWRTIASGEVWQGTLCNRGKDGGLYWVESTIVPYLDAAGRPYQYVSIRTDISHIKRDESILRRLLERTSFTSSEEFFRCAVQALSETLGVRMAFISQEVAADEPSCETIALWDRQGFVENFRYALRHTPCENVLAKGVPAVYPAGVAQSFPQDSWLADQGFESYIGIPLREASGKILGHMGLLHDQAMPEAEQFIPFLRIFADRVAAEILRMRVERSSFQYQERLRRGQLYASIGTWDWNIQTGELFWTEGIAPLFGYPKGDLDTSYENFLNAVHPDDRQAVVDAVNACIERDVPYEIEHRVVWPDGSVRWLMERGAVLRDAAGGPLQMLGVVQDISVRKWAELALHESQAKLRGLFELSPLGISLTDMNGRYLEFNEAFSSICGYTAEELQALDYQMVMPSQYDDDEKTLIETLLRTGSYGPYEKEYLRKDGSLVPVRLNGILIQDQEGRPAIWSIVEDIGDRRRADQQMMEAREAAELANRAKSEFLSNMSHELRTPLSAILGFGQLLEYQGKDALSEDSRDNVSEILKAGRHLLGLINEVLDLSKVESGQVDLSLEPVALHPVTGECVNLMVTQAEQQGVTIRNECPESILVRADRTRLKQVLLNLLSNAVKYNRPGGEVRIKTRVSGEDRLRIMVEDTGIGIPADRLKDLFRPFNRLGAESSAIEGTGIGLTITRRLVEMMGGEVDVQSTYGKGSLFWVELPLEAADHFELISPDGGGVAPIRPPHLREIVQTVLYVEDNPANIKLVARILGQRPHIHLLTAHTPELGIELAMTRRPRLILLDINLPGMDGYRLLEIIRGNPGLKAVPVVAVTARAMPSDIERGRTAGFDDYLVKPLDVASFVETVERLLQRGGHG